VEYKISFGALAPYVPYVTDRACERIAVLDTALIYRSHQHCVDVAIS